jgi:glycosyltransferase involved in cell wall biosynthesis
VSDKDLHTLLDATAAGPNSSVPGSAGPRIRVVFLTAVLPQYRLPFHERVRSTLATSGIDYDLIYGQPSPSEAKKGGFSELSWGKAIINRYFQFGPLSAVWQPALQELRKADLAVIGQENRLLINYILQAMPGHARPKVALWGHGRNFQSERPTGFSGRWKAYWATRCDWWFAYTEDSRRIVEGYGFPSERITVFQNTIDTSELISMADAVDDGTLAALRERLGIGSAAPVAVYVGGIYDRKRIAFLMEAALEIRARIPDFVLLVVGDGPDRRLVEDAAMRNPWIRYLGSRFGREKAEILRLGRVFVMPGLVGLAILDCAAARLPIVTTAYPYHSPEIAYLIPGKNGLMVADWQNVSAYANVVVSVLSDDELHDRLAAGAADVARRHTIDEMARRFCEGVVEALAADAR